VKGTDRTILFALPLIALAIGFYLLVLSPKQKEAGELQDKIDSLNSEITLAESEISTAESARAAFSKNYADIVKLGTAVPEDDDQATLISDLNEMGANNDLDFQSFQISDDAAATEAPTTPAPTETSSSTDTTTETSSTTTTDATTTAAATETAAATLPIGAAVGPAGLPITPYTLDYTGGFFDMAGLFADLDDRVKVSDDGGNPVAHGRLMTVDGFAMSADPVKGFPSVAAQIAVTTYMVPADQGIAAGATPAGPAPVGSPDAPVTVSDSSAATAAPTAAVSP
jgi:hypothetical protein